MRVNCAKPRHCTCPAVTHARPLLPHSPLFSCFAHSLSHLLSFCPTLCSQSELSCPLHSHTRTHKDVQTYCMCVCLYWWLRLLLPTSLLLLLHAHLVAFNDASRGPHTYTFDKEEYVCVCESTYERTYTKATQWTVGQTPQVTWWLYVCMYVKREEISHVCEWEKESVREGAHIQLLNSAPAWAFWGLPDPLTHT